MLQNYDSLDLQTCNPSDIIQGFEGVKSNGKELEDYIDPENGLLTSLGRRRIIEDSEIDDLEKIVPYQTRNEKLLRKITLKMNTNSKQFIEALCEDEQDHIAKFIVTAGCKTDSDERLLPRELRKVIDDNMFCLEKLIDTEKRDLELKLVTANCITSRHRERLIHFKPEDKAHELLIILQRRRYKDFFSFMECLRKTMQNNIVKILEKGGVTEIQVQLERRSDWRTIELELIKKLTGLVNEDNESELSVDQRKIVDEILAELAKQDIYFIGTCPRTSNTGSISVFLQSEKDDPSSVLTSRCEPESLKTTLQKLFQSLLPDKPPLVKKVTTGEHSIRHPVIEQNKGKLTSIFILLFSTDSF